MKKSLLYAQILIAALLLSRPAGAQTLDTVITENPAPLSVIFPPLKDVIDSAIKNHPMVLYRKLEVEVKESNMLSQKNYWLRNLGVQADSRYGTFDNFSSNDNGQSTTLLNTTNKQFNYGVGVYFKFPLVDMLNRKNQVSQAKKEMEQARQLSEVQVTEIRQMVIKFYNDALLKQRLLQIKSQAMSNGRVNMEMVEKEFRNGQIPVSEYVRISDIVSRSEGDYEQAKSDFLTAKQLLEEIAGFSF